MVWCMRSGKEGFSSSLLILRACSTSIGMGGAFFIVAEFRCWRGVYGVFFDDDHDHDEGAAVWMFASFFSSLLLMALLSLFSLSLIIQIYPNGRHSTPTVSKRGYPGI